MSNLLDIIVLILSCLLILCLVIIFIEILLRMIFILKEKFLHDKVERKNFIDKEYHTYLNWIENWDKPMFKYLPIGLRLFNDENKLLENSVKNNSLGFRTHEFSEKKKEELRVILLGGSSAWGCGSSSNQTNISGHLEKIINNNKKLLNGKTHSRVFNLSQVIGTQTQDILSLIFHAKELNPDIVVTFIGWNELITSYPMNENFLKKYKVFYLKEMENWQPPQLPKIKNKIIKQFMGEWILNNFKVLKFFFKKKVNDNFDITDKILKNLKLNSSIVARNFHIIESISKGFKFKTIHFLQPNIFRKSILSDSEAKILELYEKYRPIHGGKKFSNFLKHTNIYDYVCHEVANTSLKVINFLDIFDKEKRTIFFTLVHLNDLGYKLIAEEIYKNLLINNHHNAKN